MIRPFLAPRWLAWHAAVVAAVLAFVVFGGWQLRSFTAPEHSQPDQPRVELSKLAEPGQRLPDRAVGRRVLLTGEYDVRTQVLVPARRHGGKTGFLVVTPLRTAEGVVAVNRGWVQRKAQANAQVPGDAVTVRGVLQASEPEAASRVDLVTPLPEDQISYLATVQLLRAWPYPSAELYDGYVVLTSQRPLAAGSPEPVEPAITTTGAARWRNFAYALQWWVFALAALFFWGFVIRRAAQDAQPNEASG